MIELIAALTTNSCIGIDNKLPWSRLKGDMLFFKKTTTGKAIIMGRNTFESLGSKPLPKRLNIVISSTLTEVAEGVEIAESFQEALEIAHKNDMPPIVIGGGRLYSETIDLVDVMYLTMVNTEVAGDTFFPAINFQTWKQEVEYVGSPSVTEGNDHGFTIYKLTRE